MRPRTRWCGPGATCPSLRDAERFDAWLYRLIVRACADIGAPPPAVARRDHRRCRPNRPSPIARRSSPIATSSNAGLRRLTDAQRTILVLHFYLGLSPSETADALEIPVGTAKSRLHYAIEALRAAIAADERSAVGALREGRTA